ncbi:hypothetical protein TNCV_1535201 [Trichonephila clavipes]|uniref:Uncharacterized protein n=1 Tax=Trichonephila clavipes TaxID=2585209 RepID=A0A8X6R7K5_TRICX|nr:hypothetical protein TNCV_1535201 [Trichonephila clavipes]
MTPFELLFGTKRKSCQGIEIVELLNDEITAQFQEQRYALRQDAKKQIYKVQDENRRTRGRLPGHAGRCRVRYVQWTTPPAVLRVEQSTLTSHTVRNVRLNRHTGKYVDGR